MTDLSGVTVRFVFSDAKDTERFNKDMDLKKAVNNHQKATIVKYEFRLVRIC